MATANRDLPTILKALRCNGEPMLQDDDCDCAALQCPYRDERGDCDLTAAIHEAADHLEALTSQAEGPSMTPGEAEKLDIIRKECAALEDANKQHDWEVYQGALNALLRGAINKVAFLMDIIDQGKRGSNDGKSE